MSEAALWVLDKLAWVLVVLVGFIVKSHLDSDREFRERVDAELKRLREALNK